MFYILFQAGGNLMVSISLVFKIAAIAIVVEIINQILKRIDKSEYTVFTSVIGVIIAMFMIVDVIVKFFSTVKTMFQI